MVDPEDKARLERLEKRIDALKRENAPEPRATQEAAGGAELAWRMVIELVAGIGIGFGIGFGLDHLFGTLPIFLMIFALLGFAAGVRTMMRSAEEVNRGRGPGRNDPGTSPDETE